MERGQQLSRQEEKVLAFARQGLGDKQIALELGLSTDTVRTYWQRIRKKVGAGTRAEIVSTLSEKQTKAALEAVETEKDTLVQEILRRKSTEKRLRASEQQFRLLADAMPQIVFAADASARAVYFNQRFYEYTGLSPEKALGGGWMRTIHKEDVDTVQAELKVDSLRSGSAEAEIRIRQKDGAYRWHMCRSVPVKDDQGRITQWFGTATDIHEKVLLRHHLEEQRQNLEQAQNLAKLGNYEYDLETKTGTLSANLRSLLDLPSQPEWLPFHVFTELISVEDYDRMMLALEKSVATGADLDEIYRIKLKSGRQLWVRSIARVIATPSGTKRLNGTLQDITEAHQHAEVLAAKQSALTQAEELAKLGSFTWNIEEEVYVWSENLLRLFGLGPNDPPIQWPEFQKILKPDFHHLYIRKVMACLEQGIPLDMEYEAVIDGESKWFHVLATPEMKNGKAARLVGTCQDVTDRVLARNELSRRNAQMEFTELATNTGSFFADYLTETVEWSSNLYRLVGRDPAQGPMWSAEMQSLVHPDEREEFSRAFVQLREGTADVDGIYRFPRRNAEDRLIHVRALRHISGGRVDYSHGYLRDVTDAKRDEFRLKMSEQRFRAICENAPFAIFLSEPSGDCVFVNKAYVEMSGRQPAQLLGKGWVDFLHPDDREHAIKGWEGAVGGIQPSFHVTRGVRPDGTVVYGKVRAFAIEIDNKTQGFVGVIEDVSDTYEREQEQMHLDQVLENTPDYIGVADASGTLIYMNTAAKRLFGDIVGSPLKGTISIFDLHPEWAQAKFRDEVMPIALENGAWTGESAFLVKDGKEMPIHMTVLVHRDAEGNPEYISGIARETASLRNLRSQLGFLTSQPG
jgi:PAS domain S-box-containing protein